MFAQVVHVHGKTEQALHMHDRINAMVSCPIRDNYSNHCFRFRIIICIAVVVWYVVGLSLLVVYPGLGGENY